MGKLAKAVWEGQLHPEAQIISGSDMVVSSTAEKHHHFIVLVLVFDCSFVLLAVYLVAVVFKKLADGKGLR